MRLSFSHVQGGFLVFFVICFYVVSVTTEVQTVPAEDYRRMANEIRVTESWRFGYALAHHGAFLVKTRNSPDFKPVERDGLDSELDQAMAASLRAFPKKSVLEALFYGIVLAYVIGLVPWLRRSFNRRYPSWISAALREEVYWIGGWTLFLGPLLLLGYGESLYTTWAGPGALSYSGPYLGLPTGQGGETLAYRTLLELACLFPCLAVRPFWFGDLLESMRVAQYLWVAGIVFWGEVGAVVGVCKLVGTVGRRSEAAYTTLRERGG